MIVFLLDYYRNCFIFRLFLIVLLLDYFNDIFGLFMIVFLLDYF